MKSPDLIKIFKMINYRKEDINKSRENTHLIPSFILDILIGHPIGFLNLALDFLKAGENLWKIL